MTKSQPRSVLTVLAAAFVLTCGVASSADAGWTVDVEGGAAFSDRNDVRIPGDNGTDISLSEDLSADPTGFFRFRLGRDLGDRQHLSLLVAPLRLNSSGSIDRDVDFNGVTFGAGEQLSARYRFDSYRLTYRYTLVKSQRVAFGLGFTAKVRDAAIKIESATESSEKTNTGFVPLINFSFDWSFASKVGLMVSGDALAAPQGRAEDVLVAVYSEPIDDFRIRLGYRILEGGADNDEVYNFALIHYAAVGVSWTL